MFNLHLQLRKTHGFSLPFHTLNTSVTCFFQLGRRGEPVQRAGKGFRKRISIYLWL